MDSEDSKLLDSYTKQRLKAEKNTQLDNEARLSHYIAYLHEKYGNFEEAIAEHKRAVRILEALSRKIDIAVGYRTLGECYCKQKEYKKALHLHEKYFLLAKECNDIVEQQRALTTIGNTFLEQSGDRNLSVKTKHSVSRKAEEAYLKSLKICDKIKGTIDEKEYVDMRARNFYNLGLVYEGLEDTNKSKEYLKKAVSLSQSHSLLEVLFICQKALGDICVREEDPEHADLYLKAAHDTVRKLKNKPQEVERLLALAQVSVLSKNIPHSRHLLKKAHKLCQKNEDEKLKIYDAYKAVVSMETTTKSLQKTSTEDIPTRIACYDKLGDCAADLKLFKLAIKFYSKELCASVDSGREKKELIPIYISLAQTYCDCGQYEKAIGYYKKEIDCYQDGEYEQVCRSWLNIATYEEKCDRSYKMVQMSYVNAHNAAKKASNRRLQCRALSCLIDLFKVNKDEKLMKKTQDQLEHVKHKYGVLDLELEEESQAIEEEAGEEGITLPADEDVVEMSDLTESEDDEIVVKTVRMVHKHGRRQKEVKRNDFGETPLHRACIRGDLKKVKELIQDGHPVNVQDHSGWIPLHEAANNNWYEVTEYLLQHGANINHRGGEKCGGMTPLIDAASVGWLDIMELLLKYGANAWAKDDHQLTALDHLIKLREENGELDRQTEIKYNNLVGMLKERNPAYKGTSRNKLLSQLKTTALVPESECASQTTTSTSRINKTKGRLSNELAGDSDSDKDTDSAPHSTQTRKDEDNLELTSLEDKENFYTDSEEIDVIEQSATDAYRNAISSVGRSAKQSTQSSKHNTLQSGKSKSSALIEEDEFIENDWLVNDLKPTKQKKVDVSGYLSTGNIRKRSRSGSISPDPRFERRKSSCSSNQKKRLKVVESDSESDDNSHNFTDRTNGASNFCDTNGINDSEDIKDDESNKSSVGIPDIDIMFEDNDFDQLDVIDVDLHSSISSPVPTVQSQRLKKSSQKQLKLTDFTGSAVPKVSKNSSNRLCPQPESSVTSSSSNNENQPTGLIQTTSSSLNRETPLSSTAVIRVKVNVEGVLLIIPVIDTTGTKTFEWLADEAARRYYKMKGVKLKLTLGKDGAHFSPEDLVSLMLADNDLVESFVDSKDEQPPMSESYKNACQKLKTVCYKNISSLLQACEVSGKLHLIDLALKSQRFLPITRAFQHQTCLRDLDIRGNRIGDTGLENLCKVLSTVPNITTLCLACNDITTQGLNVLATTVSDVSKKSLQCLSTLDVSYNPLYDDSLLPVSTLIKGLPKLTRLQMSSCKLTTKFFHTDRLQLTEALHGSSLQHFDVSFNQLGCVGVELFLKCQNPSTILTLDLSGTTVQDTRSSQLYRHLYNYASQDGCVLQQLILTQCNLCVEDADFLVRLPAVCKNLQKLDITGNSRLTGLVLQQIFQSSACDTSNLDEIVANQCGIHSPLSVEFLDFLSEKLSSRIPLKILEFTCFKLEKLDLDSLTQVWSEKYEGFSRVECEGGQVKLTVSDHIL